MTKPTEAPEVAELEQQVPVPEASDKRPEEPATDTLPEIPDFSHYHTDANPAFTESSDPLKKPEGHGEDIIITGTSFREPGRPTVLAKHSKDEFIERRKMKFDIADYSQLTVNEVLSGYLNQVHSSRDLEIDMVKHMHQKYEV